MSTLGHYLRELRNDRGWSLREAAERSLGAVSHGYLANLESGTDPRTGKEIHPSPVILRGLAQLYNVDYAYLLGLAGYDESPVPRVPRAVEGDFDTNTDIIQVLLQALDRQLKVMEEHEANERRRIEAVDAKDADTRRIDAETRRLAQEKDTLAQKAINTLLENLKGELSHSTGLEDAQEAADGS